jgi:hypothetical protein
MMGVGVGVGVGVGDVQFHRRLLLWVIMFSTAVVIYVYGVVSCTIGFPDRIMTSITVPLPWTSPITLTGWNALHVFYNVILYYLFPEYVIDIVVLGVLWEMFEFVVYHRPDITSKYLICDNPGKNGKQRWMYYDLLDIPCNLIGIALSRLILLGTTSKK